VESDFEVWWHAARLLARGIDPYQLGPGSRDWPYDGWLFYPLPAVLLTMPVAPLPLPLAGGIMLGIASGLLAWALSADGWWRLWLLAHPAFLMALKVGQWSPLLTAAALVPALSFAACVKPTLGLPVLLYRPRLTSFIAAGAALALGLVVLPRWPLEWLANLRNVDDAHPIPLATALGAPLLSALLRWRSAEGRLLTGMACVPQLLFFADQLPVLLVARSQQEAKFLTFCGLIAWMAWKVGVRETDPYVRLAAPYVLAGVYLPALLVVLRAPLLELSGALARRVRAQSW
jgi:hypothetical protein